MSETLNKVDELLANRRSCIETLEQAAAKTTEARGALARAEEELAAAWAVANDTGWSNKELNLLGFTEPTRAQSVRKRSSPRRPAAKKTEAATPADEPTLSRDTDQVREQP